MQFNQNNIYQGANVLIRPHKQLDIRRIHVKSVQGCSKKKLLLLVCYDQLCIMDLNFDTIVKIIKKQQKVRSAVLSDNGNYIFCHYSDNTLRLICVKTGNQISEFIGIPQNTNIFCISQSGNRILGGNNQMICLWKVSTTKVEILTRQWKNINCYAINSKGSVFALGTFNGQIYILRYLENDKCGQIQFKGHTKCVMIITWFANQMLSVDYDQKLIIYETDSVNKEWTQTYRIYQLNFHPKEIKVVEGKFYLIKTQGVCWFEGNQIVGINTDVWSIISCIKQVFFLRIHAACLEIFCVEKKCN